MIQRKKAAGIIFSNLIAVMTLVAATAQPPEERLSKWVDSQPIEKIYLHFDRQNYLAGQTAWFKAYLLSEYLPDTISTNLYVELLDSSAHLIDRKILPILAATSQGQFDIPDSLHTGYYFIRAYTPSMLVRDSDFVYMRNLFIYGKADEKSLRGNPTLRLEFFPEGGNLVGGLRNSVAFKCTNEKGMPVVVKGWVLDEKGSEVTRFSVFHDGMGLFDLEPAIGQHYHAVIDSSSAIFELPGVLEKGIVLTLIPHPQGSFFEIQLMGNDPSFMPYSILGQMQNSTVFSKPLNSSVKEWQGVINTGALHSGIMQVTVFNKEGMPLAERLCFVNNHEYQQQASLFIDTLNFTPRAKNKFRLSLPDTVQGSLSISVTDPSFELEDQGKQNILSTFLLTSDLRGHIHNPSWYFSSDEDSVKTSLDLLMMVNGWRRFTWHELTRTNVPSPRYNDRGFISIGGTAFIRGTRKPYALRPLLILLSDASRQRISQLTTTDKMGKFHSDSLFFFGKARLLFSDIKGKKSEYIDVIPATDSITRGFTVPLPDRSWTISRSMMPAQSFAMDYDAILKANGIMLSNVTVTSKKKTPIEEVDDRYTRGAFSGFANRSIDLVNSEEANPYNNIFEYLQSRVPGLDIEQNGSEYSVFYRQQATVSAMGVIPMVLFLDEIETDATFISAIPANQVALVKVFDHFPAATGNAPGGALAIYTKSGKDYVSHKGPFSFGMYNGYSVVKQFYAPDYSVNDMQAATDHRITLDWRPSIICNFINPSIPFSFYNNDRTKSFRVIVEGMTVTGKLIHLDKTFGPGDLHN
jgi:hypothetical protein